MVVYEPIAMTQGVFKTANSPLYQLSNATSPRTSLENISYLLGMLSSPPPKKKTQQKQKKDFKQSIISKVCTTSEY